MRTFFSVFVPLRVPPTKKCASQHVTVWITHLYCRFWFVLSAIEDNTKIAHIGQANHLSCPKTWYHKKIKVYKTFLYSFIIKGSIVSISGHLLHIHERAELRPFFQQKLCRLGASVRYCNPIFHSTAQRPLWAAPKRWNPEGGRLSSAAELQTKRQLRKQLPFGLVCVGEKDADFSKQSRP